MATVSQRLWGTRNTCCKNCFDKLRSSVGFRPEMWRHAEALTLLWWVLGPYWGRLLSGVLGARRALGATFTQWPVGRRDLGEGEGWEWVQYKRVHHPGHLVQPRMRRRGAETDAIYYGYCNSDVQVKKYDSSTINNISIRRRWSDSRSGRHTP